MTKTLYCTLTFIVAHLIFSLSNLTTISPHCKLHYFHKKILNFSIHRIAANDYLMSIKWSYFCLSPLNLSLPDQSLYKIPMMNDLYILKIWCFTVCSYHVAYAFQSESTLYSCLNVKELVAQNWHNIWSLSDCNGTVLRKELLEIQANIECGHTVRRVRDRIRTYSQMHRPDKYSQHSSIIWPV